MAASTKHFDSERARREPSFAPLTLDAPTSRLIEDLLINAAAPTANEVRSMVLGARIRSASEVAVHGGDVMDEPDGL